jgi:aryl-alcohol dehydrogenase-like predicted oxidoreductase
MKRRDFIKTTSLAAPMLAFFPADLASIVREQVSGKIEKRSLGQTGEMLSVIGFSGLSMRNVTSELASQSVIHAIDSGVNYFDVAPAYGNAEIMLGPALENYRPDIFLSCKTGKRTKAESRQELEQSLSRMRTDHFDLYQFHNVARISEVDAITGEGGALETFIEAKKEGKIRFIGFSAHTVEAAMALMDRFDFDTIMFPVNYASWYAGNFGPQVLARAHDNKMGILAPKPMVRGVWPEGADRSKYPRCWYEPLAEPEDARMGLRFTLSHPVTSAMPPGDTELIKLALNLSDRLDPLEKNEVDEIKNAGLKENALFKYSGS